MSILDIPDIFFETGNPVCLPKPTLLYATKPYGVGTWKNESLKSYVSRLAHVHRVSPSILITNVLLQHPKLQNQNWKNGRRSHINNNIDLITSGSINRNFIDVLEEATAQKNLNLCTMIPLSNILSTYRLLSIRDRHCPKCLQEDIEQGCGYSYLLWSIKCVTACHIHRLKLVNIKCGADENNYLPLSRRKLLPGICATCGSIGYRCQTETLKEAREDEVWKAKQIAELVSLFPQIDKHFSKDRTITGLTDIINRIAEGIVWVVASAAGLSKSVLWNWLEGKTLPSLDLLLNVCFATKVPLVPLLQGKPFENDSIIKNKGRKYLLWGRGNSFAKFSREIARQQRETLLLEALNAETPVSLSSVCLDMNVSRRVIVEQFPTLAHEVALRFHEYQTSQVRIRECWVRNLCDNAAYKLISIGKPISRSNIRHAIYPHTLSDYDIQRFLKKWKMEKMGMKS